jgi:hypothetical protein
MAFGGVLMAWIVVCILSARRAPSRHTVSQPGHPAAALSGER